MKTMRRRLVGLSAAGTFLALLACASPSRADFIVTPGTVVGLDGDMLELRAYSFSGALMDTLPITGLPSSIAVGTAVLGNRVFVGDVRGNVGEVNLTTGAVFNVFNGGGDEAIGDNGTNLLTYNFNTGVVREYTTDGTLVNTIPLSAGTGGSGIDGFGNRIFIGQWSGVGNIREFDTTGGLVNTIGTGLPARSISALAYDPTDGTFWVATGFGDNQIRQFSSTGALLANFPADSPFINGLDVVPLGTAAIPEPSALLLAGLGVAGLLVGRIWLGRRSRTATDGRIRSPHEVQS